MNTISTLKYKIDLQELVEEYTTLSRNGGKIPRGTCPICHGDNPTEFCILGDRYYCHKCGSSGDVIGFYSEVEGLPFYQAVEALAEKYEVSTDDPVYQKQKSIVGQNTKIAMKYHKAVDAVREYMNVKRGINDDTLEDFLIGYDKGGFLGVQSSGIVIPIQDAYGRIVGFSKRRLEETNEPKYKNTKEDDVFVKRQLLFNYHRAVKMLHPNGVLHVAEGYLDVMSAHQQGIPCVGYLGGRLTKDQIGLLWELQKRYNGDITFALAVDNPECDATGRKALLKTREDINKYAPDLNVRVVKYPSTTNEQL